MAAHEERISGKRRRLFKALSAAPVVMTLRPGSAAAASAYQCAAKIRDGLVLSSPGPATSADEKGPFLYQELMYWVLDTGSRKLKPTSTTEYRGLNGTGITEADLSAGLTVVSMDSVAPANGPFYLLPADPATEPSQTLDSLFGSDPDVGVMVVGSKSNLKITNKWGKVCLKEGGRRADFAIVAATIPVGEFEDGGIIIQGTYPQVPVIAENASAGDNQGITATCLCSVDPDNPICSSVSNG